MFASVDLSKRSWLDTPVTINNKEKKTKASTRIKWQIFQDMSERESDPFWKDYWIRASKGKFPTGFSYNGQELCYIYRNKCSKALLNDDIQEMCHLVKTMMQNYTSIYSPSDLKRLNSIRSIDDDNNIIESWSKCNPAQKDNLIAYFIIELSDQYNLNNKEREELDQTINVGVNIGAFNNKTIIIDKNKIEEIIGLDWDSDHNRFIIDTSKAPYKIKKPTISVSKKANPYSFIARWEKLNKPKNKKKVEDVDISNINNSISSCYPED